MLSCVFGVACTQDGDINTSKREIALRSQTDVGVKPFDVWPKDKQKAAIKAFWGILRPRTCRLMKM
jgi:hypothetical protein